MDTAQPSTLIIEEKQPFLTLIVRACWRPKMLRKALRSVLLQTDTDIEIIFIIDMQKRGVRWANQQYAEHIERIRGQYVYTLDDDTFLKETRLVALLKSVKGNPGVIMVKGSRPQLAPKILPKASVWKQRKKLKIGSTNGACFVTRADAWKRHAAKYGMRGSGDWNFLNALKNDGTINFAWLDIIAKETQQLGRGRKFESCGRGWMKGIIKKFRLEQDAQGKWCMPLYKWDKAKIRSVLRGTK